MELTLAENIRALRKQRKLTQEKLAEALGVTVGAVYKWESGLSVPELGLLVELADFFDTSVDALLGYRMRDNRLDATLDRLSAYCETLDPAALAEAEKTLARYPHSFRAVYACAGVYLAFGTAKCEQKLLRRALELLELAEALLPQNDNPRVDKTTIIGGIATAYFQLGRREEAVELLKRSNANGCFSENIGAMLAAFMNRPEEAVDYLSEGMMNGIISLLDAAVGLVFVYRSRGDWASALGIASLGCSLLSELKRDGATGFLDKAQAEMLLMLAYAQQKTGRESEKRETLRQAARLAAHFDSCPDYTLKTVRFLENAEHSAAFDALGATARGSVENLLGLLNDGALSNAWKEAYANEQ